MIIFGRTSHTFIRLYTFFKYRTLYCVSNLPLGTKLLSLCCIGFAVMFMSSIVHCIAVLAFQLCRVQTLTPISACPASCVCEKTLLVNCASLGLSKVPSHIPATATALDLSHNALHSLAPLGSGHMHLQGLQHLQVGNNSLESLAMCSGIQAIAGTKTLMRRKQSCVSWAPDLQLLSADRNHLKYLPRGENIGCSHTWAHAGYFTKLIYDLQKSCHGGNGNVVTIISH